MRQRFQIKMKTKKKKKKIRLINLSFTNTKLNNWECQNCFCCGSTRLLERKEEKEINIKDFNEKVERKKEKKKKN